MTWDAPSTHLLRELVRLGASDSTIARVLAVVSGRTFTSRSVNGKRYRLRLAKRRRLWPATAVDALMQGLRQGFDHRGLAVAVSATGFSVTPQAVRQKMARLGLDRPPASSLPVPITPSELYDADVRLGEQTTGRAAA